MKYEVLIIGAGHNGLVAATLLAKAGRSVLVLERRPVLGGAAATEEIFPEFKYNTGADDIGLFQPELIAGLQLEKHGLKIAESPVRAFSPQLDGTSLTLWRDTQKAQREIEQFSKSDAQHYPKFAEQFQRMANVLATLRLKTPPSLSRNELTDILPWLKSGLELKRLGKQDMMEFLRILPMSARELMDDHFQNDTLKGMLGSTGVGGTFQGPMASGTAFMMLYHHFDGFWPAKFALGGTGKLSEALAATAREHGAEIRLETGVEQIEISNYSAKSVLTEDAQRIDTKAVISNADARSTFFKLVGAPNLGTEFNRKINNVRYRGSTAKLNLALSGLPDFKSGAPDIEKLSGHIVICPSLEYLERAYDDAKYGGFSKSPFLNIVIPTIMDSTLAPAGKHVMSVSMQYAPYHLHEKNWDDERENLAGRIIHTLALYAPNIQNLILHKQIVTPLDLERDYGLTEGNIYHGQMGLDQLLFMRPVPGYGRYRTPIDNLYLCGAGTHPGGGVTGAPGKNAAREVLRDLK